MNKLSIAFIVLLFLATIFESTDSHRKGWRKNKWNSRFNHKNHGHHFRPSFDSSSVSASDEISPTKEPQFPDFVSDEPIFDYK